MQIRTIPAGRRGRLPPRPSGIDLTLLAGAAVFGAGWGLAGMCPAPALAVAVFAPRALVFVGGMVLAFLATGMVQRLIRARA